MTVCVIRTGTLASLSYNDGKVDFKNSFTVTMNE
jgi:hypothetical protein